jgi:hypothetical protein
MPDITGEASAPGTIVSWNEGIGDDKKYHVAHVSPEGITLVLKLKDHAKWEELVAAVESSPNEASAMLRQFPKSVHLDPGDIVKATYAKDLNQLLLFDRDYRKTKLPEGKEQADVFAAIKQHLGGSESEEEADAWSVMQSPLFILAVIGVIGGLFIYIASVSDPSYEAHGRRAGMKNLINWLGYTIGPVWMSVAVGSLAAIVLGSMIYQLIKRPIRQVLAYSN